MVHKKNKKYYIRKIFLILIFITICLSIIHMIVNNNILSVSSYEIQSAKIAKEFDGFKFMQLSDFHSINVSDKLISILSTFAPIYFVPGNHEAESSKYQNLCEFLTSKNVTILENKQIEIKRSDKIIKLIGVKDPAFNNNNYSSFLKSESKKDGYKVLLSHRPTFFEKYADYGYDLVFCGHAHGGQIRLPLIGALFAPDQGLFPTYTTGLYHKKNTHMIVSRGLGDSTIPLRINNTHELVFATLRSCDDCRP